MQMVRHVFGVTCCMWQSTSRLFGSAEFTLSATPYLETVVVGVKDSSLNWTWPHGTFCCLRQPFHQHMRVSFGQTGETSLQLQTLRGPLPSISYDHHFCLRWSSRCLGVTVDGIYLGQINLSPQATRTIEPHAQVFVRAFARPGTSGAGFHVEPMPSPFDSSSIAACYTCMHRSPLGSTQMQMCTQCEQWFCRQHMLHTGRFPICEGCAEMWQDVLGGAQELTKSLAAQAQASHLASQGDVLAGADFSQVADSLIDCREDTVDILPGVKRKRIDSGNVDTSALALMDIDEEVLLHGLEPDASEPEEGSILHEIASIQRCLQQREDARAWHPSLRHIVQGAIAVHRLRLVDISRREEVFFLELIEGSGQHVRAHGGQCFFLSEHGHWAPYNGVVPQGTLARCKKFLLLLEGLFRQLPRTTARDSGSIIDEVHKLAAGREHGELLAECEKAAICRFARTPSRRRPVAADDQESGDAEAESSGGWTAVMANTISKLYVKLYLFCSSYSF
jgi:hypothetical protein